MGLLRKITGGSVGRAVIEYGGERIKEHGWEVEEI